MEARLGSAFGAQQFLVWFFPVASERTSSKSQTLDNRTIAVTR